MSVLKISFCYILLLFLFACSFKKKITSENTVYKGDISICNTPNEVYKFYFKKDSLQSNFKLYTQLGVKIVDLVFKKDTAYVQQSINQESEKIINFYLKKYESVICFNDVLSDFFTQKMFLDSSFCYRVEKIDEPDKRNFYNIYSLNNERIITLEKSRDSKKNTGNYRIFNESFCIKLYLK